MDDVVNSCHLEEKKKCFEWVDKKSNGSQKSKTIRGLVGGKKF